MKIFKILKLADYFTMGNFLSGFLAIIFCFNGGIKTAAFLLMLAMVFDFLDGKVARWTKKQNDFGKELDSLSDVLSFGVAVAIFGYAQGLNDILSIAVLSFFSLCGMVRLARFNVSKTKGFIGMPITANGLIFPILFFIMGSFNKYVLIAYLVSGMLMISDIKIKKI